MPVLVSYKTSLDVQPGTVVPFAPLAKMQRQINELYLNELFLNKALRPLRIGCLSDRLLYLGGFKTKRKTHEALGDCFRW